MDNEETPVDQSDWMIEGTKANRRVEELCRRWKFWAATTVALLIGWLAITEAILLRFWTPGRGIGDFIIIATHLAVWCSFFKMHFTARKIEVWTEDE